MIQEQIELLKVGDVVQIDPSSDNVFGGHFLVVEEIKSWGVQGYCPAFPMSQDKPVLLAYYRPRYENIEFVGPAVWVQPIIED